MQFYTGIKFRYRVARSVEGIAILVQLRGFTVKCAFQHTAGLKRHHLAGLNGNGLASGGTAATDAGWYG